GPHSGGIVPPGVHEPMLSTHHAGTPTGAWSRPSCSVVPSSGALRSVCSIGHGRHAPFAHGAPDDVAPPQRMLRSVDGAGSGATWMQQVPGVKFTDRGDGL